MALENEELIRIQADVDAINRNLRRVVWNGRLMANNGRGGRGQLKAILQQVNDAGTRMRERADRAIRDLYRTSLGRAQQQASELSRLAADIMGPQPLRACQRLAAGGPCRRCCRACWASRPAPRAASA